MGLPYSKEIQAAVEQLAPVVAAVQTTRIIFILLAAIEIIKVVILAMILLAILALLVTMNPDLEDERAAAVTPAVKWFIHTLSRLVPGMHIRRDVKRLGADRDQKKA